MESNRRSGYILVRLQREPDYDGECARPGPSNNWGDHPCSAAFPVICERE
jgi:hypothetical protein